MIGVVRVHFRYALSGLKRGESDRARRSPDQTPQRRWRKPGELRGSVRKRRQGAQGGWRRNDRKVMCMKRGDPSGEESRWGVRVVIGARKRGNSRGAKGDRKKDA